MSITEWVTTTGQEFGLDLSAQVSILEAAGVTMGILPKLSDEEWKELIPQVGPRTVLRKASSEMPVDSSNDVLEQVQKLRDEKEKAETQLGQVQEMNLRYKEQSDRVQQSVTEKMGSIIQVSTDRDDAKFQAESQKLQLSQLTRDVAGLKVEREGIKGQLEAAEKERDEAEKQAMALSAYASGR